MTSLQNICVAIKDQGIWRTLHPSSFQPLSGIRRVSSSCGSTNLYPSIKSNMFFPISTCLALVCGMFSLHILLRSSVPSSDPYSSLCACGRAENTSVSRVCVASITQSFHISRLLQENTLRIDRDCELNGRNFPGCHFWRTLISHLPPERSTLLGMFSISTQPVCSP